MQKVFLSHSSKDKETYVRIVAKKLIKVLGENNVILDEISFQEGRKTIEEIEEALDNTDLFVFFCSEDSLKSKWVQDELFQAEKLWKESKLQQICPIIIDASIKYDDKRMPEWLRNNYNIQYISRPTKTAQVIQQRMIELSFERHPRLKEKNEIFVGRNELINVFEERFDDFEKEKPLGVVASGIKSIGRRALIRHCIVKCNIKKPSYPFPGISMNYDESIEDFILKLYDLGLTEEKDLEGLMTLELEKKVQMVVAFIREIQSLDEILFVEDNGSIINHDGEVAKWFVDVLEHGEFRNKLTLCFVSRFKLRSWGENVNYSTRQKMFSLEVDELSKRERDGLLSRYLDFENIELEMNDMRLISGLLVGFPEQVFYSVGLVKEKGIEYVKNHTEEIVEFNSKKAGIIVRDIEKDADKVSFLALLSMFDYISIKYILEIVEETEVYVKFLEEFISKSICEYVGVLKEYIRVNETIKDYIVRNNYQIKEKHHENLSLSVDHFLTNLSMNEYDIPEYLFSLKEALISEKKIDSKFIVPSLYLKTMTDLYNKRKNKEVVMFADKALENEAFMDPRIVFEIRYLLCSALAKQKDNRFKDEVHKIKGADYDFLYGFYYRQIGRFDKALEMLNESMKKRPNFSKAKREIVQVYIGLQEFQTATDMAKENYLNYKDNPYHIQAYFSCLIRSEKNRENKKILESLIASLADINSDVAREMTLRCKAQMAAFYEDNEEEALAYINEAIELNPNIHYARIVKFDICERFDLKEEMEAIILFFQQPEYKNKYQSNITCFQAIMMARNEEVDKAVDYFKCNIRDFTDEAKEKFIVRLKKYESNLKS